MEGDEFGAKYSLLPPQDNAKELEGDEFDAKFESAIEDMSGDEMSEKKKSASSKKGAASKKEKASPKTEKTASKKEKASKPNKEVKKVRFREKCFDDSPAQFVFRNNF